MKSGILLTFTKNVKDYKKYLDKYHEFKIHHQEFISGEVADRLFYITSANPETQGEIEHVMELFLNELGIQRLLVIGFAGAVSYKLSPLAVVIIEEALLIDTKEIFKTDEKFVKDIKTIYPSSMIGNIASVDHFVDQIDEKNNLHQLDQNIIAVDMDVAYIGKMCQEANIPFASIKCITDNANNVAEKNFRTYKHLAGDKIIDVVMQYFQTNLNVERSIK